MTCIIKHLRFITFLLPLLGLLQSCVVYHKESVSLNETADYEDRKLKIYLEDGSIYKVDSIVVKGEIVECFKKTKQVVIDTSSISRITIIDATQWDVNLISALNHDGITRIEANDYTYDFVKIEEFEDKIIGHTDGKQYMMTNVIPKNQIVKIKSQNKYTSKVGNVFIGIGAFVAVIAVIIGISVAINPVTL